MARAVTRINKGFRAATEFGVLLAAATCPVLMVSFADRPFEPHKAASLWAAAAVICATIGGSPAGWWRQLRALRGWAGAIVACAALQAAAIVVSTSASEAPMLAWFGSALRRDGGITAIACLALLLATILLVATRARWERVADALVLGSVGPTVYALFQAAGLDPLVWDAAASSRASSTLGNPLFFAGYVATMWPLTLGRAIVSTRGAARGLSVRAMSLWGLLALQSAALVLARSRGPLLALAVAVTVVAIVALPAVGYRRWAKALAGMTAAAVAIFLVAAPAISRAAAQRSTSDTLSGADTVRVRLILWQAMAAGLRAHPVRLAFGFGPESTSRIIMEEAGRDLRRIEGANTSPDRVHNDTLETLGTFGIVGLLLHLAIVASALGCVLAATGLLLPTEIHKWAAFQGAAFIATFAFAAWRGGLWMIAMAPAAAIVLATGLWVLRRPAPTVATRDPLVIGIVAATAAWLTHFVDLQLSVATIASSVAGVTALALACATCSTAGEPAHMSARVDPPHPDDALAILSGWSTAVLTIGVAGARFTVGPGVWLMAVIAWGLSLGVAVRSGRGVVQSALAWLIPVGIWLSWRDAPGAVIAPLDVADRVVLLLALTAGCLAALLWFGSDGPRGRREWFTGAGAAIVGGVLAAAVVVPLERADVLVGFARQCKAAGDLGCAARLFGHAADLDPTNHAALVERADALMNQAEALKDIASREVLFAQAEVALSRANAGDPFDYHHPRNLGALDRRWALRGTAADRPSRLEEADRWYAVATARAPRIGVLWAEWGNLDAERRQFADALRKLERAAVLGATTEAATVYDAVLRAEGQDLRPAASLALAGQDLASKGYPALAAVYARRAADRARR